MLNLPNSRALTKRKAAHLATRKRRRHPNRALTEAEIRLLLSSVESIRDDSLIRLGLSVGSRVSEVVTICTSEIDFDHGLIKIWDEKKDRTRAWSFQLRVGVLFSSGPALGECNSEMKIGATANN